METNSNPVTSPRKWATREEESLAWFHEQEHIFKANDLESRRFKRDAARPPEWFVRGHEYDFRRGFRDGYEEATLDFLRLSRAGYNRPREVANIMGRHSWYAIRDWMRAAFLDKEPPRHSHPPSFKQESWSDVRAATFKRDMYQCVRCDSPDDLEAHHVHPVADGGLPDLDNLKTLCEKCHRGKPVREHCDNLSDEDADLLLVPIAQLIGFSWEWVDGEENYWQAMPADPRNDDDFWWWHMKHRPQWFKDRRLGAESLAKSFRRWQAALK